MDHQRAHCVSHQIGQLEVNCSSFWVLPYRPSPSWSFNAKLDALYSIEPVSSSTSTATTLMQFPMVLPPYFVVRFLKFNGTRIRFNNPVDDSYFAINGDKYAVRHS